MAPREIVLSLRDRLVLRYLADKAPTDGAYLIDISRALPTGNAYPTVVSLAGRGMVELVGHVRPHSRVRLTVDGLEAIILSGT